MDQDLIQLLLSYNDEPITIPPSQQSLLIPKTVRKLSNALADMLSKTYDAPIGSVEQNIGKPILDLLKSWCELSINEHHNIMTDETLKVIIQKLNNGSEFEVDFQSADDIRLFRACIKNSVATKFKTYQEHEISSLYHKSWQDMQTKEMRQYLNKKYILDHKEFSWDKWDPSKMQISTDILTFLPKQADLIHTETVEEKSAIKEEKSLEFAYALHNLKHVQGTELLLKRVIDHLLISNLHTHEIFDFVTCDFDTIKSSTGEQQTLAWEQPSIVELCILETVQHIIKTVQVQPNLNFNDHSQNVKFKSNIFNVLKDTTFLTLCKHCSKSKKLFQISNSILNHILINTNYDVRILSLIHNYVDVISGHLLHCKCNRLIDLYSSHNRELIFWLNLSPEVVFLNETYSQDILNKLNTLYIEKRLILPLLLSHFPKWMPVFKKRVYTTK